MTMVLGPLDVGLLPAGADGAVKARHSSSAAAQRRLRQSERSDSPYILAIVGTGVFRRVAAASKAIEALKRLGVP